jgi:hypothetical protein
LLLVLTPAVAMTAVAVGLRIGARGGVRAAVVYGARPASHATVLAWQVVVFDEAQGAREPVPGALVTTLVRTVDGSAQSQATTNADGVAEVSLADATRPDGLELEVRSGGVLLASGRPAPPPPRGPAKDDEAGWLRFARRDGPIQLDVAALGERVAPGVPAELWVHATDAATQAPVSSATVALEGDTASPGPTAAGRTDSRGWVRIVTTPVGLAVSLTIRARSQEGRTGEWVGGLYMSPGAPSVDVAPRVEPGSPFPLGLTMPTARSAAYVEIDDDAGRAWAATPALTVAADGSSMARLQVPALPSGRYWAVAAADPAGAASLAAGTITRPFFVAPSDEAALALGTNRAACAPPRDPRETASALSSCLALSPITPVPRWLALDGFVGQRALDREARTRGLAVALGAIAVAILLEGTLLWRAAARSRAGTVAVAILVGLLGFALLAAFIVRV